MGLKRKVNVTGDVAKSLADADVVIHGGYFSDAYTTVFTVICPHVMPGLLGNGDREVLTKILGDFNGEELTLDTLEEAFLASHPGYAHGRKRKRDAWVPVQTLLIPPLMSTLPKEFTTNVELQEKVHTQFTSFMEALEKDFTNAGLVDLCLTQLDSVVIGIGAPVLFEQEVWRGVVGLEDQRTENMIVVMVGGYHEAE